MNSKTDTFNNNDIVEISEQKHILSIRDILFYLRINWIWCVSIVLLFTLLFAVYAIGFTTPKYTSKASLIVKPEKFSTNYGDVTDYSGGLRATDTIAKWLTDDLVLEATIEELGLEDKLSISALKSCISTENSTTDIFIYVSMKTNDPDKSKLYLEKLIEVSLALTKNYTQLEDSYSFVSPPSVAVESSVNPIITTFVGLIVGIAVALLFAIIKGIYSSQFLSVKDVEQILNIKTLGAIVDDSAYKSEYEKYPISVINQNNYENLMNNIYFSNVDNKINVIAVTSSAQDEGKSSVIFNLAHTMSSNGKKVIIIDLDLRRSKLHHYFDIQNGKGLTDFVTGQIESEKIIVKVNNNLDVITAGGKTMNPALILQSDKLSNLIQALRKNYDYVLLDTPPVFIVDTKLISIYTDAFLFIVSAFKTKSYVAKDALKDLANTNTNILGSIVTRLKQNHHYGDNYKYKASKNE